jgi:hypothetical protein
MQRWRGCMTNPDIARPAERLPRRLLQGASRSDGALSHPRRCQHRYGNQPSRQKFRFGH